MGTKQDCENGDHTSDNRGFCWWCGCVVNADWAEQYLGKPVEAEPAKKKRKSLKKKRPTSR